MILLEVSSEAIITLIVVAILMMLGPPVVFLIIGMVLYKKNRDRAKVFFILSGVYLLVALGVCASFMG